MRLRLKRLRSGPANPGPRLWQSAKSGRPACAYSLLYAYLCCAYCHRYFRAQADQESMSTGKILLQSRNLFNPKAIGHIVGDIIRRNGVARDCEETVSNSDKSHPAVRHGFAGRSLQYVSRLFPQPFGGFGSYEPFSAGEG